MPTLATTSIVYFAIVFAAGFILGTIRTLFLIPAIGPVPATLLELPAILAISWFSCQYVLRRWQLSQSAAKHIAMGMIAFGLLIAAEAALSVTLGGLTLAEHVALYSKADILLGLAGQVLYGLFPWMQTRVT
jgi:hypothetical protein